MRRSTGAYENLPSISWFQRSAQARKCCSYAIEPGNEPHRWQRWNGALTVASKVLRQFSAVIAGLVLLVLVPSLPLWAFSALASMVYAVMVPLAAISMTLLYGDAVAQQEGLPAAGLVHHGDDPSRVAADPA